jgi:hypothetical protein
LDSSNSRHHKKAGIQGRRRQQLYHNSIVKSNDRGDRNIMAAQQH